ncbi:MAG: AlkZ family DNA glycosylase [Muribaculaceae bacterium]|nr:AlkZ family DNA glycosylase [Muribaculaceae bacterium]
MNIPNIRLLSQQLAAPLFNTPRDVIDWFGFMQAQEKSMLPWAVAMRMRRPSLAAYRKAYDEGQIIRTHLFRCTWQLTTAEDLRWMQQLSADGSRRAARGYLKQTGGFISEYEEQRANDIIASVLQGRGTVTGKELKAMLAECGLTDDAHTMSVYLRFAEYDGVICSGKYHPNQNTYALLEERVPAMPPITRDEALALLSRKYFRSHAPATLDDFVWWTGLTKTDCLTGIDSIKGELIEERFGGVTYYLHTDSRTRGCRGKVTLLPSYDEYLIGYKSRHHVLADGHRHHAHTNNGIFYPVILQGGHVVGKWHPRSHEAEFFDQAASRDTTNVFSGYDRFLNQ